MTTWAEFAQQAPELAAFGEARFRSGVAYLGTVRDDGSPRLHPVTPIIGEQLYLFMEPTCPRARTYSATPVMPCTARLRIPAAGAASSMSEDARP
jgi:hypothetical protein